MLQELSLHDPHSILGLHQDGGRRVIRLWRPGAEGLFIEIKGKICPAKKLSESGFFECEVPGNFKHQDYRVYHSDGRLAHDPYAFLPTLGEVDTYLMSKGVHYKLYEKLGGRLCTHQGCEGASFAVWAPNAQGVSLVGDFNGWDGRANPMRSLGASGIWELFVPGLKEGEHYKFEIRTAEGHTRLKADPYALFAEVRPKTASRLFNVDRYRWKDEAWMKNRRHGGPMAIYEVHLGSWKEGLGYRELAHALAKYCQEMHFNYVELLPISEHPLDESWGYQVTGFFAATSRFGSPEDFQYFVDYLHGQGIGVILDWVPGHFPMDEFSLAQFDGTYLYEHADPRQGFHPHWNTYIFNYGRPEVTNFLIASALYWLDKMHVDALRVDAVASMLYLDYGRKEGEWIPNIYGGKENLDAIAFMKHLNAILHEYFPTAFIAAEESTAFPGVTRPVSWDGLGFDYKWNLGWMNDTLHYFHKDPIYRHYHQNMLTFGLVYVFTERFISVLSHDEVVHGKGSLIAKMPGDDWQKFANLRLLYSYMICQPGKKLLFMGAELGQWGEWNCKREIDWYLLQYERHQELHRCFAKLNAFYQKHAALWENDFDGGGFEWVDFYDTHNSTLSYFRKGKNTRLLCVHNFTPNFVPDYRLPLQGVELREVFNTDSAEYGGSGKINGQVQGSAIQLAPLATMIFEVE
ncbi:MAG: 1,4-alpha-glucan branching protein GlgB [Verrucomicrobia bacterium]|nr:1,4-alpha-glucan branching protein GlgB [Verrucomicrobiota bacterium]